MAEVKQTASAPPSDAGARSGTGFELRLERGGASVRLADRELAPGLHLESLSIQIPDVKFPFDVGQGASQFRHRLSDLSELSVAVSTPLLEEGLRRAPLEDAGLRDVHVEVRDGFGELAGRLAAGPVFTVKAGLLPQGELGLRLVLHSPRVFGVSPIPAALLPHLLARALAGAGLNGVQGSVVEAVAPLLRQTLAPRGWKVPRAAGVRLARVELTQGVLKLGWTRGAEGGTVRSDPDLLAAEEGAAAFSRAETALAQGDFARARELLLGAGPSASVHPFAAERLLSLFLLEERFHEEVLDLSTDWLQRRPGFAPALLAEALVRLARGEGQRAARAFRELARFAAERGEVFSALAAAEAAFSTQGAAREDVSRAIDVALSLRRDHVPALRALRALAAETGDREALLRADRRIVTYDPDDAQKARAHAELGELLREADPAAARLHLDQALRLAPEDPVALVALSRACAAAGEELRAVRALDRLRELHLARGDRAAAAAVALEAGALWEGPLTHAENALLRYRAAVDLAPSADAHARVARAAEKLGQWVEAADHHAAVISSLDPAAPGAAEILARTRLALADVAEKRLGDPAGAAAHLEAAAVLQPGDAAVLERLAALHRTLRRPDGLASALDRLAPLAPPPRRAALLAEAGEALLELGNGDAARVRFTAALAHDPISRPALTGLARLAAARGDVLAERDALARLVPMAGTPAEAAELQDRLAAACEGAGDLTAAARAARAARGAAPTAARLATELRILRKAGDSAALAALLPEAAQAAAAAGDPAQSAALRLEQAQLLGRDAPAAALAALAEAHAAAPGDPGVLRAQADLSERTGDLRLTLAALRALLATAPADAPALEVRAARAALTSGEVAAAREHATRAEAAGAPGAAELLVEVLARTGDGAARAELLVRMGRLDEAAELLERTGRTVEAAPLLARLGKFLAAAAAWQSAGQVTQATAALAQAAEDPAQALEALPKLVDARLAQRDAAGAASALVRLARLRGGREGARLAWRAYELRADPAAVELAIGCDPEFAPARAHRAIARAELDPRGSLADAEAALASPDLPPDARPGLLAAAARAADLVGDEDAALRHLRAYSAVVPGDATVLARLAALTKRTGDAAALAAILDRRIGPASGPEAVALRIERAELFTKEGDAEAAARLLEQALELDPESLAALRALTEPPVAAAVPAARRAELLGRRAAHPRAEPDERTALHAARARLLAELGEAGAALEALRAAAAPGSGTPPDDEALELRAALAGAAGEAVEAAEALLERARRAEQRGEAGAADRLAEAGLAALAADVPGGAVAVEAALALGPGRENARAARLALVERARAVGDADEEQRHLEALVPLLRTGERPAALLRLSALALAANDVAAARRSADAARTLAPRDPAAVEAARAAAEADGDLDAAADRLADLAELLPAERGPRLLARARLLAFVGRAEEADHAFETAIALLPPDRALAEEHLRLRREHLPAAPAAAPLEAWAARTADKKEAARAFRTAAALALQQDDRPTALRCARRAAARTRDDLAFAGPLLARLLYEGGSWAEALVLHRRLFEAGLDRLPPEEALVLARQLAELGEESGETELARAALEQVLALRPSDLDAAMRRFRLDPDRARAARDLASQADFCRSAARRAEALALAAEASLGEIGDAPLADLLFRRARDAALRLPARAAAMARRRVDAFRAAEGTKSVLVVEALGEAADHALKSGNRAEARELLTEAAARARDRGQLANAAQFVSRLSQLVSEDGDAAGAAAHAREAGDLYAWAGMLRDAALSLKRALGLVPDDAEALALFEAIARAQGDEGAGLLAEALQLKLARAAAGPERAEVRVALADAYLQAGGADSEERAEAELRRALEEDPGCTAASERLSERLSGAGRDAERARLLLERSSHETDRDVARALRREAATLLAAAPGAADRAIAASTFAELSGEDPKDLEAHRAAANLFRDLGQRERSISHLAALVRASPDDEAASKDLAEAYSERHRERGELFLQRAEHAQGETRAVRLREAAKAFFAAGEDPRARAALLEAFHSWPADDTAFVAALREATTDVERIDQVLSARAAAVPGEAGSCHRARADALLAFGESERAVAAYQAALAATPEDVAAMTALAACLAAIGRDAEARTVDERLVARIGTDPKAVPPSAEANARYRLGLAAWAESRPEDGIVHLERALALAPSDERAGIAWAALAHGHASRGDGPMALAAAHSRAERAHALGLQEEHRQALEAGADLASQLGEGGRDAAEILVALTRLRHADGEPPESLEPLARRAATVLEGLGEAERAREVLALAGAAPEPIPAVEPEPEPDRAGPARDTLSPLAPVVDLFAGRQAGIEPAPIPTPAPTRAPEPEPEPDPREAARQAAERALAIEDPTARSAAFVAYADALRDAGTPADDVRTALDLAAEADPDAPEPWRARAQLETSAGQPLAAARAHLSISIRTEGEEAARSALEAARLFQAAAHPDEAARAYRVAVHAEPGCTPARIALAEEALTQGDAAGAAEHLLAVDPERLPHEERPEHGRRLARTLEAAGRSADAEAVWTAILQAEPTDAEAFEHAGELALARGALDGWIELARLREQTLAREGDVAGRIELRRRRGEVLAGAGRVEAARGALLSALELAPDDAASTEALVALDANRPAWDRAAEELVAEAAQVGDPAERAVVHLRRARILHERLGDPSAAALAAEQALDEARTSPAAGAARTAEEAEALLRKVGQASPAPDATEAATEAAPAADPVSAVLRAQAEAAAGDERAELFERLAGHLERSGDREGAADALLAALEADPARELTYSWLRSVAAGDVERLERAEAIRLPKPVGADDPGFSHRTTLLASRPQLGAEPELPATEESLPPSMAEEAATEPALVAEPASAEAWAEPGSELVSEPVSEQGFEQGFEPPAPAEAEPELPDALDLPPLDLSLGEPPPPPAPPELELEEPGPRAPEPPPSPEPSLELDDGTPPPPALDFALPVPRAPAPDVGPDVGVVPTEAFTEVPQTEGGAPDLAASGRQHLEAQDWELAYADLSQALEKTPGDLDLLADLVRAAEKVGQLERYVELGERLADARAPQDPLGAAARLRTLAGAAATRLGRPDRAAQLLEKALKLVPGDPDTQRELAAMLAERPRNAPRALESWLGIVRQDPADAGALSALAALCVRSPQGADPATVARLGELGRIAASLAAFVVPTSPRPPAQRLPTRVPPDLRAEVALPAAVGPSARLLSLLAPWLEPLFPADLGRRGASSADWLAPPRAPALRAALEAAARALGCRPHAAFLTKKPGNEVAIENTQPPAMVFAAGVGTLPEPMLHFLAARSLDLVHHGWALAGKFAPRDVGILLELACRFAGGTAPSLGLPAERAGSYLGALTRTVPTGVLDKARLLANDSARELARFEPATFGEALRRTANRVALLYSGDPGAALRTLALLEAGAEPAPDPNQALSVPDLGDLARFALSDRFLELRLQVLR